MRHNNRTIFVKLEATYGLDPTPTGALNAVLASEIKFTPLKLNSDERNLIRPYYGNFESIVGAAYGMAEFSVEIAGSGAAGTVPAYGAILRACGVAETNTVGVKTDYAPVSTGLESVTIYYFKDGQLYKLLGAMGTVAFEYGAQKIPRMKFSFTGLRQPVTTAVLPAATYTAFQKPIAVNKANTTLALHSFNAAVESFSMNVSGDVQYINRINREYVDIVNRKPSGQIVMEEPLLAAKDFWTIALNVTTGPMLVVHGTVAGQIVELSAPAVQVEAPDESEAQNISMISANLRYLPGALGNDEFKITVR